MIDNLYGLFIGMFFGFLLQQARVLRYDVQLGMLRFQNMTALKFMLTAMITAMVLFHWLAALGLVAFKIKAAVWGANIVGGLLFGIGWAMCGYCPGTAVGAVGEGRFDAVVGIIGGICGAGAYAWAYPLAKRTVEVWGVLGKVTLADWFHVNPWVVIVVFALVGIGFMCYCEVNEL